jgi:preprotein translocase subunit SecA
MYGQLRAAVQEEVVRKIYHPTLISEAPRPRNVQAIHPDAATAGQAQAQAGTPGATRQAAPTPVRVQKMPGRNDLCYCGSGKKYKHCHMKSDAMGGNGGGTAQMPVEASPAQSPGYAKKKQAKARRR